MRFQLAVLVALATLAVAAGAVAVGSWVLLWRELRERRRRGSSLPPFPLDRSAPSPSDPS